MSSPGMPSREIPSGLTAEQAMIVASQQAYQQQQERLRAAMIASALALWANAAATGALSPAAATKWVSSLMPVALGGQRAVSAVTQAQLNAQVRPDTPISISPASVTGANLRGVDPETVYERPFATVRNALSQGKPMAQALDAGRRRAQSVVATDMQLAHTHTARSYLREAQDRLIGRQRDPSTRPRPSAPPGARSRQRTVTGYRRQLSSKPNHCALCVLASTQRYRIENLMPIHPGCGCTVTPIFGQSQHVMDPRMAREVHDIVRRDLGESYVDAGGRLGDAHYRDIIVTNEHGELGPVLGVRGQHFQGRPGGPRHLGHVRVNPPDEAETDAVDLDGV